MLLAVALGKGRLPKTVPTGPGAEHLQPPYRPWPAEKPPWLWEHLACLQ